MTLAFLSLLAAINAVLFNVAFPNISRDLHLVSSQVSWIAIGYSMVVAIGSIIYGKLADAISLRKLFLIGIGLFILGSLLGFSKHDSLGIIILARMLQASGGLAFITLEMVAVRLMIEPQRRPLAFSFIIVGIALAIGLGPLIAGALISRFSWPVLFLVMLVSILLVGVNLSYYYLLGAGGLLVVLARWFKPGGLIKRRLPLLRLSYLKTSFLLGQLRLD